MHCLKFIIIVHWLVFVKVSIITVIKLIKCKPFIFHMIFACWILFKNLHNMHVAGSSSCIKANVWYWIPRIRESTAWWGEGLLHKANVKPDLHERTVCWSFECCHIWFWLLLDVIMIFVWLVQNACYLWCT